MKKPIEQAYQALNIQLNEWYQCMPYEALSEIHQEDVYANTLNRSEEFVNETLYELRSEWFEMPMETKMEWHMSLKDKYESFIPKVIDEAEDVFNKSRGILSLYSDDFERSHMWEDICEIVGADAECDNISFRFIGFVQYK